MINLYTNKCVGLHRDFKGANVHYISLVYCMQVRF